MAELNNNTPGLFTRLGRLFSTDVIIRNVGGDQLKVIDVDRIQAFGNVKTNALIDRFTKLHRFGANMPYNPTMNYATLRIQLYTDYEAMDTESIIASALDIIADESTLKNEVNEVLQIRSADENIQKILYNLFYDILNIEFNLWLWTRNMCKYGDFYLHLEIAEKFGIYTVVPLSVYDMVREEGQDPSNPSAITFKIDPSVITSGGISTRVKDRDGKIKFENYEIAHFRLLTDANYLPYGRCLKGNSRIYTENSIKEIQNITKEDKVWTFNIEKNQYELANVLATKNSGLKSIFKIATTYNEVNATDNHPFLVWNFEQQKPSYKQVKDLQIGDYLCSYKHIDFNFKNPLLNKTLPNSITNRNQFLIDLKPIEAFPERVNPEFARFWGFMLGDGWENSTNYAIGFARGINTERNEYYENLLKKYSGKEKLTNINSKTSIVPVSGVVVNSKTFYDLMIINGYEGKSYSKRLPEWIYGCDRETQLSLIKGLMDADGYTFTDKWNCTSYNITLNNKELLLDIKTLLDRLKIKTGKIRPRKFTGKCTILGKEYNAKQSYDFTFYLEGKFKNQPNKFNIINPEYNIELHKIKSITEELPEETYDIQVDKNSNFIADGVIVHNSFIEPARKTYKQYVLMKDAMLLHRITRAPEKRVFTVDVGNIPPHEVDAYMQRLMQKMKKTPYMDQTTGEYNLKYNAMNMMEDFYLPTRGDRAATKIDTIKGLEYNAIDDVNFLRDEMLAALKVPKAFFGFEKDLQGKATLAAEDIRFARTVERIQRIMLSELYKMALVHLYVQGYDGDSLTNFELSLTTPSIIFEQEKVALWKEKVQLAKDIQDTNLMPSDWIYDNVFQFSEDQYDEYRDLVLEDKKRAFRLSQVEHEGNDPAKSGKSYGTPHDLASLYGKGRMGQHGSLPPGYDEDREVGRPREKASIIGTSKDPLGKDRTGKIDNNTTTTSAGEKISSKGGSPLALAERKGMLNIIPKEYRKQLVFNPDEESTLLSEDNIKGLE